VATLIKNGTIVTGTDMYAADLLVEDELIACIAGGLDVDDVEVVDATGQYVMPGGVEVHTHLDMPFMGTCSSDDFETGTIAAAMGGTTTLVDFIVPEKGKPLSAGLATWRGKSEGKAVIDYGFHCCIVEMTDNTLDEMAEMVAEGITSFKMFTAYPGVLMADDGAIFRALRWAAKEGALLQFHCENGPAIAELVDEIAGRGDLAPKFHGQSRPSRLEGEATARVLALAEVAGAAAYIVHLTCNEALEAVRDARRRGVRAFAETCPQYLYLSSDDLAKPGFEGAKVVCSPPVRDAWHQEPLWRGLATGDLQVVATDHCPFNYVGQKDMGKDDFRKIPNGMPALETRMHLIHEGVNQGRLSLTRFVDAMCTQPAKLFGLYPQKGALVPGADADIVIWDPKREVDLSAAALHMRVDYSPYEGKKVMGGPTKVYRRGQLIVDGDRFLGAAGEGRYLRRQKFDQ